MGHPGCSAAAGETNSLSPSLGGADKGSMALRAPGRTNGNGLLRPAALPHLCPRPLWVLRTCLPTPATTRAAPAQTCFMDWRCGLGKWGAKEWAAEIKVGASGWVSLPSCFPSTLPPHSLSSPLPCPSCLMTQPYPFLSFPTALGQAPTSPLGPSSHPPPPPPSFQAFPSRPSLQGPGADLSLPA